MIFTITEGRRINIEIGDFVDIRQNLPNDALWGRSYEVIGINNYIEQIEIKINMSEEESIESVVDCSLIVDNFTLVQDEE